MRDVAYLAPIEPAVRADLSRDLLWLSMLFSVSDAAEALESQPVATVLYGVALPFRHLSVLNPGGIYLGSVEHHLGVMAATFGDRDLADCHFNAALEAHTNAGATEWMARTKSQLGEEHSAWG